MGNNRHPVFILRVFQAGGKERETQVDAHKQNHSKSLQNAMRKKKNSELEDKIMVNYLSWGGGGGGGHYILLWRLAYK